MILIFLLVKAELAVPLLEKHCSLCSLYTCQLVFSIFKENLAAYFNLLMYFWVPSQILKHTQLHVLNHECMLCLDL